MGKVGRLYTVQATSLSADGCELMQAGALLNELQGNSPSEMPLLAKVPLQDCSLRLTLPGGLGPDGLVVCLLERVGSKGRVLVKRAELRPDHAGQIELDCSDGLAAGDYLIRMRPGSMEGYAPNEIEVRLEPGDRVELPSVILGGTVQLDALLDLNADPPPGAGLSLEFNRMSGGHAKVVSFGVSLGGASVDAWNRLDGWPSRDGKIALPPGVWSWSLGWAGLPVDWGASKELPILATIATGVVEVAENTSTGLVPVSSPRPFDR